MHHTIHVLPGAIAERLGFLGHVDTGDADAVLLLIRGQ
jgi:hypothetical protein